MGFEVLELEGVASGGTREARFELERGRFCDARVAGSFDLEIHPPLYPARLEVELDDADLDRLLDRFEVPLAGFASRADGRLLYVFDLVERGTGQGSGDFVVRASGGRAGRIPATGTVPVRIVDDVVELPGFELSMPEQEVMGSLRYAPETRLGRLEARVESRELGALAGLLPALEPGAAWTPTAGTGELRVDARLAPEGARVELGLDLRQVETAATAAEQVTGRVAIAATAIEEIDLELRSGPARLALGGRVPFDPAEPGLDLDLLAESWPLSDARPWLPFELPLDGPVQGRLGLTGSVERLAGTLLARIEPVHLPGLDAERFDVELRWDPERAWIERAALVTAAGEVTGAGTLGFESSALDLRLAGEGLDLSGSPFDELIPAALAGSLAFTATVSGTIEAPELEIDGGIEGLRLEGRALDPGASTFRASLRGGDVRLEAAVPGLATVTGTGRWEADGSSSAELALDSERLGRLVELGTGVAVEGLTGSLAASVALSSAPGRPLEAAVE
ncbi:MAG TPA: hypothetical protein VLA66_09685, partial [Thermoanaerobaculia bacterium]|nr:hypothetical protein [Thermoanaerobaculia bacterium]